VIDTDLREHAVVGARAAALRAREMPTLQAALEAVRAELGEPRGPGDVAAKTDDADTPATDSDAPADPSVTSNAGKDEIDETPSANTADNVF
jgi:hypothetical protein